MLNCSQKQLSNWDPRLTAIACQLPLYHLHPSHPGKSRGVLKQHIKKILSSTYILTFWYDLDSFLRRIHDWGVLWIQASLPDWWDISRSKCRIGSLCSLPRTNVPPSWSRPEAKTGSVLYRISEIARADKESVDASLKGSTGKRSALFISKLTFSGIHIFVPKFKITWYYHEIIMKLSKLTQLSHFQHFIPRTFLDNCSL